MKNIIIALLMIPVFGFSQNTISSPGYVDAWHWNTLSKNDTVKVVMLVCDTAGVRFNNNDYIDHFVYWQFGYQVLNNDYWELAGYLDENKKPLSKNIIVWQAKNIYQ